MVTSAIDTYSVLSFPSVHRLTSVYKIYIKRFDSDYSLSFLFHHFATSTRSDLQGPSGGHREPRQSEIPARIISKGLRLAFPSADSAFLGDSIRQMRYTLPYPAKEKTKMSIQMLWSRQVVTRCSNDRITSINNFVRVLDDSVINIVKYTSRIVAGHIFFLSHSCLIVQLKSHDGRIMEI